MTKAVFYDDSQRRGRLVRRLLLILSVVAGIFAGVVLMSLIINPPLHSISSPIVQPPLSARHLLRQTAKTSQGTNTSTESSISSTANNQIAPKSEQVIGFFVNWDDTSLTSLKSHLGELTTLVPEWLHLNGSSSLIEEDDSVRQQEVLTYLSQQHSTVDVIPLINNFSNDKQDWDTELISKVLNDPNRSHQLVQALFSYVTDHNFKGISIDFESLPPQDRIAYTRFIAELGSQFHSHGLLVSVSVPTDDIAFDYQQLAASSDYLILMNYDEHAAGDDRGAIASQNWFAQMLNDRMQDIPASKLIVAIGNYGYDWPDGPQEPTGVSYQEALKLAQATGSDIQLDPDSLNPTFAYSDAQQKQHQVWFLDATSGFNQIRVVEQKSVAGIALWRMGSEDPALWTAIRHRHALTQQVAESLQPLKYGYDVDYQGQGPLLKVLGIPQNGLRTIAFDSKKQLIADEQISSFPKPYEIGRWGDVGTGSKKLVLTFDDGPDPLYTPQILKILADKQVSATFFVIGASAEVHPELLRQMYAYGNLIGNHTYTHPNIATISVSQLQLELNATQRLIQSQLGVQSFLFRPPYAEDVEPETPEQVEPLYQTSQLGYYTVGIDIDPSDWEKPGVDKIVNRTLEQAKAGDNHVILLHDGGGDRTQTVAALPLIIDKLRQAGFTFVNTNDLLGLDRATIMPAVTQTSALFGHINLISFLTASIAFRSLVGLSYLAIALSLFRLLVLAGLAFAQRLKKSALTQFVSKKPHVTIIVPAYNEAKVIEKTVRSVLEIDYPAFNILVVDDGSSDDTALLANRLSKQDSRIELIVQENAGKAAAINNALAHTKAEFVVMIDADTQVRPNLLKKLMPYFGDSAVAAVAGNAKVGNRINMLTRWQALEYVTSQNLERRAFDMINGITVVPGAIGAWRRPIIQEVGGFTDDTLAEDADLTVRILRAGYKVRFASRAIGYTEAPDNVRDFLKQRFRWVFGTIQVAWKHKTITFKRRFGALGLIALPGIWLFQILLPLLSPALDLLLVFSFFWTGLQAYAHPASYSLDALKHVATFYGILLLIYYVTAILAFLLEKDNDSSLLIWVFFQRLVYRQLMYIVLLQSLSVAVQGKRAQWRKLDRKASVNFALASE